MLEETNNPPTLKALREKAGYTQQSFAKAIGAAQTTVGYWERGIKDPSFSNAVATARLLGVPLKTLAIALGLDVSGIPDDGNDEN